MGNIGNVFIHKPHVCPLDWTTFPDSSVSTIAPTSITTTSTTNTATTSTATTTITITDIHINTEASTANHMAQNTDISSLFIQSTSNDITTSLNNNEWRQVVTGTYDYILLTDCIFSVLLVPFIIQTLLKLCHTQTEVICCHEIRDEVST